MRTLQEAEFLQSHEECDEQEEYKGSEGTHCVDISMITLAASYTIYSASYTV